MQSRNEYQYKILVANRTTDQLPAFQGLGCNQFVAEREENSLKFTMSLFDWGEGGQITERLADGIWLYIWANASGQSEGSILQASGRGEAMYCPVSQESAWGCATRFCATDEFRLRFSRRE
ncbi:MAG TPA: hypothetical protein VFO14_06600 [Vicinamibacterales bacterium]|nr:hypothetical protein [Vicinamibacterales bacterium]